METNKTNDYINEDIIKDIADEYENNGIDVNSVVNNINNSAKLNNDIEDIDDENIEDYEEEEENVGVENNEKTSENDIDYTKYAEEEIKEKEIITPEKKEKNARKTAEIVVNVFVRNIEAIALGLSTFNETKLEMMELKGKIDLDKEVYYMGKKIPAREYIYIFNERASKIIKVSNDVKDGIFDSTYELAMETTTGGLTPMQRLIIYSFTMLTEIGKSMVELNMIKKNFIDMISYEKNKNKKYNDRDEKQEIEDIERKDEKELNEIIEKEKEQIRKSIELKAKQSIKNFGKYQFSDEYEEDEEDDIEETKEDRYYVSEEDREEEELENEEELEDENDDETVEYEENSRENKNDGDTIKNIYENISGFDVEVKRKRGRPKKKQNTDDNITNYEISKIISETEIPKKKRGRRKKHE